MNSTDEHPGAVQARPPLLSISLAVAAMLLLPLFLYSVAPEEPLKEGVVVFSNGKQRVYLNNPDRYQSMGYTNHCVLEPQEQLVIVKSSSDRHDRSFVARFEGKTAMQFPFCPPQSVVIVKTHQIAQKDRLLREFGDKVADFFGR